MRFCFKKYTFLLIGLISIFFGIKGVNAASLNFVDSGYYYNRVKPGSNSSWHWNLYDIDGNVSYCIENDIKEGNPLYEAKWEDTGLRDSIKERLTLVAYYGYTYPGHNTLQYRAATQGMIWETILGDVDVSFTKERWSNGDILDISKEKEEINKLIDNHYKKPSFDNNIYDIQVGRRLTLIDENNVINDFNIDVKDAKYEIKGNKLIITPNTEGKITVNLKKKNVYENDYNVFVGNGVQNMITPGNVDSITLSFTINSYYSYIEGYKKDIETNTKQGEATLEGAIYGIYEKKTNNLITTVTTDKNGYFRSDKVLKYNDYYLKEISPSKGYLLDDTFYNIYIKNNEKYVLEVTECVIKNKINILKQYNYVNENTTFLNPEEDIIFEIYDSKNNKYSEIKTDKNGYASIDLPYGTWQFHQNNVKDGYEKINDFYVTVSETSENTQYYNILNNKASTYLKVVKIDSETKKVIKLANTKFKILNIEKNAFVSQYVGGKYYDIFSTDESGSFTTYLKLEYGKYKLIEIEAPRGYELNESVMKFEIGKDSKYEYTENGTLLTLYFENKPKKGTITVNKKGEFIKNNNYYYSPLDNIEFKIYAEKDIKSTDNSYIYYRKGDLVDIIKTNKLGIAKSKELPYGKYYIKEYKTLDEYVIDNEEYYFEIKENEEKITYEIFNKLKRGSLKIIKKDKDDNTIIPETKIGIYDIHDNLIYSGITDEKGELLVENMLLGKYYIKEIEPKKGYVLDNSKHYFEIKENEEKITYEIFNKLKRGSLKIIKKDKDDNTIIPETKIGIYDIHDNLIYSGITDEKGELLVENMLLGKYYIKEIESKEGYVLDNSKHYFEIKENEELVTLNITNKKEFLIQVPNTYKNNFEYLILVITLFINIISFILLKKYEKEFFK